MKCEAYSQQAFQKENRVTSSPAEAVSVTVAALLIIAIGFSIGLYANYFGGFSFYWTWELMAAFAVILAVSMLSHEAAHKIVAEQNGLWAEFRLTTWGIVLTFVSIFLPFKIISPGATMIAGPASDDAVVKFSVAGPLTNLVYSGALLGVAFALISSPFGQMVLYASYVNAFMAAFNLIPVGILDGQKIFNLNKKVWLLAFIPSAVLAVITFLLT